jgi:hypothetical protein
MRTETKGFAADDAGAFTLPEAVLVETELFNDPK